MTSAGLRVHMGRCPWKDEFEVDRIVGHRGAVVARQYKVRWKDYSEEYDTWEPRGNIHPDLIKEYEVANGVYDFSWNFRCGVCDLPCSSARGVKIHQVWDRAHKQNKDQNFKGSLADKAVMTCKLVEQQESRSTIFCEGVPIKKVFRSKYLGTIFSEDTDQLYKLYDINVRIRQDLSR